MSSSGPDFVAVPASLLPVDSALVLMTSVDLRPPRLPDTAEPTAERVAACADLCEQMTPQAEATYLMKFLYKAPLLAARVRLELLRRRREQKVAQWRKTAKENRSADVKRKRAAAAATAELQRAVRSRVAAAVGEASGSSSSAAADAGCRGPDRNAGRSSGLAAPAPGLPRPATFADANLELGVAAAIAIVPWAAAANALGDEAGSDADTDEGEGDYEVGGLLFESLFESDAELE